MTNVGRSDSGHSSFVIRKFVIDACHSSFGNSSFTAIFLAHSFRLRDPWQCECRESGALCWSRVFHRPTGLEADDALWLVCSLLPPGALVTFNGEQLTSRTDRNEFEVTGLIKDANRIEIQLPSDLQPTAYGLQPSSPFPYDVRLGVVGIS